MFLHLLQKSHKPHFIPVFISTVLLLALISTVVAETTTEVLPARQQQLEYMVRQDCGSCHGMTLKGGLGPPLLAERLAKLPDLYLIETIKHGRPGTAMPPWLPILSEAEIIWIVAWLKKG
ncbi:MAG: cytochrome c [Pseudomonadota bacterium]